MTDLRYALRRLRSAPGFAAVAVLTLALGIGANTAMFSVLYGILIRPLPFPDSERLTTVWLTYPHWRERDVLREFWDRISLAHPEYERLREGTTSFEAVSIYRVDAMTLTGAERPEVLRVGSADDALPEVLGVGPAMGRWFTRSEAAPGGERVAVLTHEHWVTRLGGDPSVLGRSLQLDGEPYTIVGVLPEGFRFTRPNRTTVPDLWIPVGTLDLPFSDENHAFDAIGRLRSDVSLARAQAETAGLLRGDLAPEVRGGRLVPLREQEVAGARPVLLVLGGAVGLILLLACVNVANLMLARSIDREGELGIRHALGAERRRIARQLVVESLVLAVLGGTAGVLVGWLGTGALVASLPSDLPRLHEIEVSRAVLVFAVGATGLAVLLSGALPALIASRRATGVRLRAGASTSAGRGRLQAGLVATQMAIALVLLVGAGLLTRSLGELWAVDPGFEGEGVLTFRVELAPERYPTPEEGDAFFARLDQALRALPGVMRVGMTSVLPLSGASPSNSVWPASRGPEEGPKPEVQRRVVTPGFFGALGVSLVDGRAFTGADDRSSEPVMLVSRASAERLWEGADPVGDRVEMNDRWWRVVGVVEDVHDQSLLAAPEPTVYVPAAQWSLPGRSVVVRTSLPPPTLVSAVRGTVREIDSQLPVTEIRSMDDVLAAALAPDRFRAGLLGGLAGLAAVLAGIGLYGVMSHATARRTRELGVRLAIGARRGEVLGLVLRRAATTAAVGIGAGIALAVPATLALEAFLFRVPRLDPATYLGSMGLLVSAALAGAFLPAWRASRLDPTEVLRHE